MGALIQERPLLGRTVGVYGSAGAPWHHLALAASFGADVRVVRAEDIRLGRLNELDAFVMPGGGAVAMAGLLAPLGEAGAATIRLWVEEGGTYVSSCAGSVLPLALGDEAAKVLPAALCMRMTDVPMANPGDATLGGLSSPGVGRIRVRVDTSHPFAGNLPETVDLVHYNGPFFDVAAASESATPFAWPVEPTRDFTPAERFMPPGSVQAVDGDDLVLSRCIRAGAATGLEVRYGAGSAILFGSHPEFGLGPLGLGWSDGAELLVAALQVPETRYSRLQALGMANLAAPVSREPPARPGAGWTTRPEHADRPPTELAVRAVAEMKRAAARFAELAMLDAGDWLNADKAPALGGRDGRTAWRVDGMFASAALTAAADDLTRFAERILDEDRCWLDDAPRADQDFGAMGLGQLLERMHAQLDGAFAGLSREPARPAHAYDMFDSHPFHLAVGTYLSAAGLAAGSALATVVLARASGAETPAIDLILWAPSADSVAV